MEQIHILLASSTHDQARIVAAEYALPPLPADAYIGALRSAFGGLNEWAEDFGVLIGHIKGYVTWPEGTVMISTTGDGIEVKGLEPLPVNPAAAQAGLAAIVFGPELREVEKQLEAMFEKLLGTFGLVCEFELQGEHVCDESCHCHGHEHGSSCDDHDHDHDCECGCDHDHEHGCECGHDHGH